MIFGHEDLIDLIGLSSIGLYGLNSQSSFVEEQEQVMGPEKSEIGPKLKLKDQMVETICVFRVGGKST